VVRHAIVRETFAGIDLVANPASLHVWLPLRSPEMRDALVAEAAARQVLVGSSQAFAIPGAPAQDGIRLCIGAPATHEALRCGLSTVAMLMREHAARPELVGG
jgi:DNA-binding transcriptional MocR family regulator